MTSRRPSSINELATRARQNLYDDSKALKYYLRFADKFRNDGIDQAANGDLEGAFVNFARAATLVFEKIPTHRDFTTLLSEQQRNNLDQNGREILDSLSLIKPKLVDNFEQWRMRHPEEAARVDQQTPNVLKIERDAEKRRLEEQMYRTSQPKDIQPERSAKYSNRREEGQRSDEENRTRRSEDRYAADYANGFSYQASAERYSSSTASGAPLNESRRQNEANRLQQQQQQEEMKRRQEEIQRRRIEEKRRQEQEGIMRRQQESEAASRAARQESNAQRPPTSHTYAVSPPSTLPYQPMPPPASFNTHTPSTSHYATSSASMPSHHSTPSSSHHSTPSSSAPRFPQADMSSSSRPNPSYATNSSHPTPMSSASAYASYSAQSTPMYPRSNASSTQTSPYPPTNSSDFSSGNQPPISAFPSTTNVQKYPNSGIHTPRALDGTGRPPSFIELRMPLEGPNRYDGDSTDSETVNGSSSVRRSNTTSRVPVKSPSYPPPITTTSPPPAEGRVRYPQLMSFHQQTQGYVPSLHSMFVPTSTSNSVYPSSSVKGVQYPFEAPRNSTSKSQSNPSHHHHHHHSYGGQQGSLTSSSRQAVTDTHTTSSSSTATQLKTVVLPRDCLPRFLSIARLNTSLNKETCGLLLGKDKGQKFMVTCLLVPKQHSTSDTCTMDEEELVLSFTEERNLITLGWIHTHPSQSCFMSSLDLHTHASFQRMLPESFAVVCAPTSNPGFGIFRLTDPPGLKTVLDCQAKEAFHPHPDVPIYTDADKGHVQMKDLPLEIVDLR